MIRQNRTEQKYLFIVGVIYNKHKLCRAFIPTYITNNKAYIVQYRHAIYTQRHIQYIKYI